MASLTCRERLRPSCWNLAGPGPPSIPRSARCGVVDSCSSRCLAPRALFLLSGAGVGAGDQALPLVRTVTAAVTRNDREVCHMTLAVAGRASSVHPCQGPVVPPQQQPQRASKHLPVAHHVIHPRHRHANGLLSSSGTEVGDGRRIRPLHADEQRRGRGSPPRTGRRARLVTPICQQQQYQEEEDEKFKTKVQLWRDEPGRAYLRSHSSRRSPAREGWSAPPCLSQGHDTQPARTGSAERI